MVEIKNLRFAYGENVIFNGLSVTLPERGVVAVTGESGSGKTTLLNVIAGLIKCEGVTVTGRVAYMFQDNRLLPWLTAAENVALLSKDGSYAGYLAAVGLSDEAKKYPSELSGGQQRRVAFAAAAASEPDILLLDEPTANLDKENADVLRSIIKTVSGKALVVIASHSEEDVAMAEKVIKIGGDNNE